MNTELQRQSKEKPVERYGKEKLSENDNHRTSYLS